MSTAQFIIACYNNTFIKYDIL